MYNTCVLLRVLAAQTCRKRRNSLRINMKTLELTLQVGDFVVKSKQMNPEPLIFQGFGVFLLLICL